MRTRYVGILSVLLAAGCAHGQSSTGASARERDEAHQRAESRESQRAGREQRQEASEAADEERRAEIAARERERQTAEDFGTEPDNTRVNERDRSSAALTPFDQGTSEQDRDLTAQIRRALVGDDSLSFTAKNTKIITRDGLVTLRGTVVNAREKATLQKTAQQIAGKDRVVDELEIEH